MGCHHELSRCVLLDVVPSVFKLLALVKCAGQSFLYLLSGNVFTSASGSTLTGIGLLPCSVIIWSVV